MGNKVPQDVVDTEAKKLKELLGDRPRPAFCASLNPPITRGMIHQHENGVRPISLRCGRAYAFALGVSLAELSPRLAEAAGMTDIGSMTHVHGGTMSSLVALGVLGSGPVAAFPGGALANSRHMAEIIEMISGIRDQSKLAEIKGYVRGLIAATPPSASKVNDAK